MIYAAPVLDWAHDLTLRGVANGDGDGDETPAMRTLVESGLVAQLADGRYELTPAGRVALEAGNDPRKRWALLVLAIGLGILAVSDLLGWIF